MSNDANMNAPPSGGLLEHWSQLEEFVVLVTSMAHGMWRFRWLALLVAWAGSVVGWTIVYGMPDVYSASTRFYVDAESMIKRVVGDLTVSEDMRNDINVLTRAMLSRPQLEKTARLANLDLAAETPADQERLIARLGTSLELSREGGGGDNIFRISYHNSNRTTAETVVRTLLDGFMEDALGERRTDSGAAEEFLEAQIADYETRLNDAEQRLADFKRENIGRMPGETGDYYTHLQRVMAAAQETRAAVRLADERRAEYQRQLQGEDPVFGVVASSAGRGAATGSGALIAQYEGELSSLLLRFTENHPDVVALKETIERLKAQQAAERVANSGAAGLEPLEANPVYQRMRTGLSEAEVDVRTLRAKLAAETAEIDRLQALVDTIPEIERQLTALDRDYEVTRQQYDLLLERRESLRITGEVEESGDQLQFRIIDPPRASVTPVGPYRSLYLAASTVMAVGAGLALAFLLHQLNPVFTSRRELRQVTGLPVLGSVSLACTPGERASSKRRRLAFAAASAALPAALGLAVLFQFRAHQVIAGLLVAVGL
jgi:polysaccharide chain length determinant protein (PEP-CTERM system associated)